MSVSFDLLREPWVPCIDREGATVLANTSIIS